MREVKRKLRTGFPKAEVFADAMERGLSQKKVSRYLANIPDYPVRPLYKNLNYLLVGLYLLNVVVAVLFLLTNLSSDIGIKGLAMVFGVTLFIPTLITFNLLKMHAWAYLLILFFVFRGLIETFGSFDITDPYVLIDLLYRSLIIGLAVFLKLKLFPFQGFLQNRKSLNNQYCFTEN